MQLSTRTVIGIAASALLALAAWPAIVATRDRAATAGPIASAAAPVPVRPDYLHRNAIVADLERDARRDPDQIVTRMLAGQYLQRYRETADVGDLLRAVALTKQSLALQPRYNVAAEATMASADVALHNFHEAKIFADDVVRLTPWNVDALAADANVAMELGRYDEARQLLARSQRNRDVEGWRIAAARYDELTGKLTQARSLIDRSTALADSEYDNSAEARAWHHWRAGELAFEGGDLTDAETDYRAALAIYPSYWHANSGLAKVYWAQMRWRDAVEAADRAIAVYPLPETLGYKFDALTALGETDAASQTRDLIIAIERIGNAQGLSDRLIALFYADHGLRPSDAVAIARRDLARRDDIYAEDTLAWALAASGRSREARAHAQRAVRLGTEDARVQYHAGVIALRCGFREEARARLDRALAMNPHFHPFQTQEAKADLAMLGPAGVASRPSARTSRRRT